MKKIFIIVGLLLIAIYIYNNFFFHQMLVGTYVNRNYNQEHFISEIPYVSDTLVILKDNRFYSPYWGKGAYILSCNLKGCRLKLNYEDEFGGGEFNTSIERVNFLGEIKINLSKDSNQYYEKID